MDRNSFHVPVLFSSRPPALVLYETAITVLFVACVLPGVWLISLI